MFPSTHDLMPENLDAILDTIDGLLSAGNRVLLVTKPHLSVIETICASFCDNADRIVFRFSIGSTDDSILRFWEPNAPVFDERIQALRAAHRAHFSTSVSCEPMLDGRTELVVNAVEPMVTESIWIGKPNFLLRRLRANGETAPTVIAAANELAAVLDDEYVFGLFRTYQKHPLIRWKDSVRKVLRSASVAALELS